MTRKIVDLLLDLLVFSMAALGSLMAFGFGAAWAVVRSAATRRNPIEIARPGAAKAGAALSFIYEHSGLPAAFSRLAKALGRLR